MRIVTLNIIALLALITMGCGPTMDVPGGFARVDGHHDMRLASPEGVVIAVNSHRNRGPRGDLQFWAGALEARVQSTYSNVERAPITSDDGVEGVQIRASTSRAGRTHEYWATIFVTGRRVVLVEAGGDEAHLGRHAEEVQAAIRSVGI